MFAENRKISLRQLQVLLLLDAFGTAVLFLPAELAQIGGRSCWIDAGIGGLVFVSLSFLLARVGGKIPEGTAVEGFRFCFGPLLGTAASVGLMGYLLFCGMAELRIFSEIVCRNMLPNTPVWVISLVILAVAGLLAVYGTECRGRAGEILFFVVIIPLIIVLLAVAVSSEYGRVLPLELPTFADIRGGIVGMGAVFQGLVFLYFIFPALRKPTIAGGEVMKSTLVATVVVVVIVFLCLAVYGESVLAEKLLPSLQMMERVSFTGLFLTRQDVLLLWFWMASVCIFLSGVLFYSGQLGMRLLKQREEKQKYWLWLATAAVFALSLLPENLSEVYQLRLRILPWLQLIYLVILPTVLLLAVRKKGADKDA